jgi:pyruvate ferredoxin oxidoreductase gamma subunit
MRDASQWEYGMVRHIRIHGRGGEGVKLASRIVSRAAFLAGLVVQDSPLYGAERRGAPVVAFARFSDEPIRERGYIDCPDAVVLMDHSLLALPEAGVLDGLNANSLLLVNSAHGSEEIQAQQHIRGRVVTLDVSSIAIELLGRHLLSAPVAGFTVKAAALASWDVLAAAVRVELAEIGLTADLVERNLTATRRAFDATPAVGLATSRAPVGSVVGVPFIVPRMPARSAAPSIDAEATSALRSMEGWRVYRPVIDLRRCTRCILCFALCPEGAIHLDAENYPSVDYQHCKGCLVCVTECPPQVIGQVREETA